MEGRDSSGEFDVTEGRSGRTPTGCASIQDRAPVDQLAGLVEGGRVSPKSVEKGGRIFNHGLWEIHS